MSKFIAFADESGTSAGIPCYAIGALVIPSQLQDRFVQTFESLRQQHGVANELKWSGISSSHGEINFVLHWMHLIQRVGLTFSTIVVEKRTYQNWSRPGSDREGAFYKTYTLLMKHLGRWCPGDFEVFIDQRQDRYPKHDEVVEKISNYMLAGVGSDSRINQVTKSDSKQVAGIQIADVLTGAVNASHREYLDRSFRLRRGKRLLVERLAAMVGWDALCYDTYPNARFNIWHFPPEFRKRPATRSVRIAGAIPFVAAHDLVDNA